MQLIFHTPSFSFQLLRILGQTHYRGADIGECLSTAYRIREGDIESWYNEWLRTANRVYEYAENCMDKGHKVSAQDAYLRATNYYQNGAAFYLDTNPSDPRIIPTWEKGIESFRKAIGLFSDKVETIKIHMAKQRFLDIFSMHQRGEDMMITIMTIAITTAIIITSQLKNQLLFLPLA